MKKLALLSLIPLLFSCSTIANYLEKNLECDEEVNMQFKAKIDFEDK